MPEPARAKTGFGFSVAEAHVPSGSIGLGERPRSAEFVALVSHHLDFHPRAAYFSWMLAHDSAKAKLPAWHPDERDSKWHVDLIWFQNDKGRA